MRNPQKDRRPGYGHNSSAASERSDRWARSYREHTEPEPKKRLRRSRNRIIGGVAGGLANYFGIDRTIFRVGAFIILMIFTWQTVLAYFVLCLTLGVEPKKGLRAQFTDDNGDVWTRMRANPAGTFREVSRRARKLERRFRSSDRPTTQEDLKKEFRDL